MNQDQLITTRLQNWYASIPLFSYFTIIVTLVSCIMSLSFVYPDETIYYLTFDPYTVIDTGTYYSIFSFPFICPGVPQAFLSIYSYQSIFIAKEKSFGTFRYIIYFVLLNVVIGVCYIPMSIFGGFNNITTNPLFNIRLYGLWACTMAELIMDSHANPNKEVSFLCFTCKLKNKYYTWVLFIVFAMIGKAIFMLIAGVMAGYICKGYLDAFGIMSWTRISDSCADRVEGKILCCCFRSKRFVTTAESGFEMQGNEREAGLPQAPSFQHVPFAGQGHRLGD